MKRLHQWMQIKWARILSSSLYFTILFVLTFVLARYYDYDATENKLFSTLILGVLLLIYSTPYLIYLSINEIKIDMEEFMIVLELSIALIVSAGIYYGFGFFWGSLALIVLSSISVYYVKYVLYYYKYDNLESDSTKRKTKK